MTTILFFFFLIWAIKAVNGGIKHARQAKQTAYKEYNDPVIETLIQQRDLVSDMLNEIDMQLDNSPPNRDKLLKEKERLLNKLVTIENRIYKR